MRETERGWAVDGCGTTRGLFRGILRLGFGLRVTGEEHVPTHSPVILAANHGSQIDPIVPAAAMPRRCTFLAAAELLTMPVLGTLVRPFNLVPLKRGEIDRRALKHCLDRLECGEARAIFPEGKISGDGRPQPARDGLGFIAYHAVSRSSRWGSRGPTRCGRWEHEGLVGRGSPSRSVTRSNPRGYQPESTNRPLPRA